MLSEEALRIGNEALTLEDAITLLDLIRRTSALEALEPRGGGRGRGRRPLAVASASADEAAQAEAAQQRLPEQPVAKTAVERIGAAHRRIVLLALARRRRRQRERLIRGNGVRAVALAAEGVGEEFDVLLALEVALQIAGRLERGAVGGGRRCRPNPRSAAPSPSARWRD